MPANQNVRLINVNGSGGAFVLVRASITCRRVEIEEDGSSNAGVAQGLQYIVQDNGPEPAAGFATKTGAQQPLILGVNETVGKGYGAVIGSGPQDSPGAGIPALLGTPLVQLRSASATPAVVRVTEYV